MNSNMTTTLASRINSEFELAQQAARTALEHAMHCGEALIEAKSAVPRGEWVTWLEANTNVSGRTAQRYMQLANNRPALESETATRGVLSIREAAKLIAKPREVSKNEFTPKQWRKMKGRNDYGLNDLSVELRKQIVSWKIDDHWDVQQLHYEYRMGACMMLQADGYDVLGIADYLGIPVSEVSGALGGAPLPRLYEIIARETYYYDKKPDPIETATRIALATDWNLFKGALTAIGMAKRDKRKHLYEVLDSEIDTLFPLGESMSAGHTQAATT